MLEIYFNTTSREAFDADGNQFRSGMPRLAYMSRDTVRVILCSETPENDNAGVDTTTWTRDTSYNVAGIGAMLTVDSDYIHKLKGELAAEVPAGSVSSVTATIASASYAKIPSSGVLRLFDAYGNYEALSYTARSIDGTSVTFTTSGTVSGAYMTGATMDCDQSPYCSALMDTAASNVEQGEFVFQLVVNSDRLREEMDYSDTEKLSVKGLEILLYKTTDGTDEPLNAFVCDTFSITGTIGSVGFEAEPPDGTENKLAGLVDQLLAAGFSVEQQYDSAGNTQFRFRSVEAGGAWSSWVTVNKGQDGENGLPCSLTVGTVTTGDPGTDAAVEITGEAPNQTVNFTIPRGQQGQQGATGADGADGADGEPGPANTLTIGTVTTGEPGAQAAATITGESPNQVLNLTIPRGETGAQGPAGSGTGDMLASVYDSNSDGKVDAADTADSIGSTTAAQVADAVGKAHEHSNKTTLDKFGESDGALTFNGQPVGGGTADSVAWEDVTGKPSTFPPSTHQHAISDVTGLQDALDNAGAVKTVNGAGPDESGNVALTARADLEFTSASLSANVLTVENATIAGLVVLDADGMQQLPEMTQSGTSVQIDFTGWTVSGSWRVQFSNILAASDTPDLSNYYTKAEIDAMFGTFETAAAAIIGEEEA